MMQMAAAAIGDSGSQAWQHTGRHTAGGKQDGVGGGNQTRSGSGRPIPVILQGVSACTGLQTSWFETPPIRRMRSRAELHIARIGTEGGLFHTSR